MNVQLSNGEMLVSSLAEQLLTFWTAMRFLGFSRTLLHQSVGICPLFRIWLHVPTLIWSLLIFANTAGPGESVPSFCVAIFVLMICTG